MRVSLSRVGELLLLLLLGPLRLALGRGLLVGRAGVVVYGGEVKVGTGSGRGERVEFVGEGRGERVVRAGLFEGRRKRLVVVESQRLRVMEGLLLRMMDGGIVSIGEGLLKVGREPVWREGRCEKLVSAVERVEVGWHGLLGLLLVMELVAVLRRRGDEEVRPGGEVEGFGHGERFFDSKRREGGQSEGARE
jgi:hypothetical protein